jgi:hypothetical protein
MCMYVSVLLGMCACVEPVLCLVQDNMKVPILHKKQNQVYSVAAVCMAFSLFFSSSAHEDTQLHYINAAWYVLSALRLHIAHLCEIWVHIKGVFAFSAAPQVLYCVCRDDSRLKLALALALGEAQNSRQRHDVNIFPNQNTIYFIRMMCICICLYTCAENHDARMSSGQVIKCNSMLTIPANSHNNAWASPYRYRSWKWHHMDTYLIPMDKLERFTQPAHFPGAVLPVASTHMHMTRSDDELHGGGAEHCEHTAKTDHQ